MRVSVDLCPVICISVLFLFLGRYIEYMTREQGWFRYLKQGLSQTVQEDRVRSRTARGDVRSRLRNLRPFVVRHWRKGVLGSGLILLTSLLGLPPPLIIRYLIDNVILGYVAQSTILLNDTIRQNLLYGNPEASDEQIIQAVLAADLEEFIASLPEGYNTWVGENGVRLSEGQKQRLSIARALIKDPRILVLDEPTSALDSQSEKSILETLPTLVRHKTLFVVAHCLSTIRDSDRILLLNENRLVAVGTHDSLMASSEYYRSLVPVQQVQQ